MMKYLVNSQKKRAKAKGMQFETIGCAKKIHTFYEHFFFHPKYIDCSIHRKIIILLFIGYIWDEKKYHISPIVLFISLGVFFGG